MDSIRHPSAGELARYASKKLAAAELLAVDDHLVTCADCRALVSQRLSGGRLELEDPEAHLAYEELEALAEGLVVAERELSEQHIRDCAMCAAELQDLRALVEKRKRATGRRPGWWLPAGAAIAASVAIGVFLTQRSAPTLPTPSAAAPAVLIRDGARTLALDQQGRVTSASLDSADADAIAAVLRSGAIPAGAGAREWNRKQEALLGDASAGEAAVVSPVAETVESDRPMFRWKPVRQANRYRVEVYDSSFNQAAASSDVAGTEWRPEKPLVRGQSYSWIVSARVGANEVRFPQPPAPEAKFEVLPAPAAAEMDRARQTSSLLLLAIVAGRHGLWNEARAALDELARLNPSTNEIQTLKNSLATR